MSWTHEKTPVLADLKCEIIKDGVLENASFLEIMMFPAISLEGLRGYPWGFPISPMGFSDGFPRIFRATNSRTQRRSLWLQDLGGQVST